MADWVDCKFCDGFGNIREHVPGLDEPLKQTCHMCGGLGKIELEKPSTKVMDGQWCRTHRVPALRAALSCPTYKIKIAAGQIPAPCVLAGATFIVPNLPELNSTGRHERLDTDSQYSEED